MMPCRIVARWTSVAFISVVAQDPPEGGSERRERPPFVASPRRAKHHLSVVFV
jgi:hypothetical protein